MKKILKRFPLISLAVLPTGSLLVCPLQNQNENNHTCKEAASVTQKDTASKVNYKEGDIYAHNKTRKGFGPGLADLDVLMKDLICKSR